MSIAYTRVMRRSAIQIWIVICVFVATLGATSLFQVDVAIVAFGRVIVSDRAKTVEFSQSGPITRIFVHEGDYVQEGAPMVQLDRVALDANLKMLLLELGEDEASEARLLSLLGGSDADFFAAVSHSTPEQRARHLALMRTEREDERNQETVLTGEIAAAAAAVEVSRARIASLEKGQPLARERADGSRILAKQEYMARFRQIDWEVELLNVEGNLAVERSNLVQKLVEVEQARTRLRKFRSELDKGWRTDAAVQRKKIELLLADKVKYDRQIDLSLVRSPASGFVYDLKVFSDKAVAQIGQRIAYIVPRDAVLEAELFVSAADVGFVAVDHEVSLKLDAYPFSTYGTVVGHVTQISHDSFAASNDGSIALTAEVQATARDWRPGDSTFFKVRTTVEKTGFATEEGFRKIRAGMSLQGDILTNHRSIADFLLSPLRRFVDEALRER